MQNIHLLRRRGLGPQANPEESDPLLRDEPWLAGLYAASVTGRIATGPSAGQRVTRTGDRIDPESLDALEEHRPNKSLLVSTNLAGRPMVSAK